MRRGPQRITGRVPGLLPNKGSRQAMLPSRAALRMLTKDPTQQTLGNYAKLTPSGAGALTGDYGALTEGQQGMAVVPALSPGPDEEG
jgi:hypothetical protein